ncbi:hypothetical protein GCM10010221_45520 [Streptomyces parvus]|nr:hypothetical protein GCM10010221_45520 [Streptomyces parvus]
MHDELRELVDNWTPKAITMANGSERLVTQQVIRRFAEKIEISTDGCWRWTASLGPAGYGFFKVQRISLGAHRFAYLALQGPIAEGLHLDHQCHTRAIAASQCAGGGTCLHRRCVNPMHLKPVTPRENTLTSLSWAAEHAVRTECVNGHRLEGPDLYERRGGGRACYVCHRESDRRLRLAKAEQEGRVLRPPPADRTHCPQGHAYDEANTKYSRGQRTCRACSAESSRRYNARKKAERMASRTQVDPMPPAPPALSPEGPR